MQAFYPSKPDSSAEEPGVIVLGPEDSLENYGWFLDGRAGDKFKIEFKRTQEKGADVPSLSWTKV